MMDTIPLELIKNIWKHKLTKEFKKEEVFNIYIDSPFCHAPKCEFCIYKPTTIDSKEMVALKDSYYDEILIQNIRDFGSIIKLRHPDAAYFGGGTSSIMTTAQMVKVFEELQRYTNFRSIKEKHFEFNPLNTTREKIDLLLEWKFTHMTFGFQTFNKEVLQSNKRTNVSLERLKEIFEVLEKNNIKYNIDLLAFIFRDNLEEDMEILKKDLDILGEHAKPRRITIFPNYNKLQNALAPENKENISRKIRELRETVRKWLEKNDYEDKTGITRPERCDETSISRDFAYNIQLIRKDMTKERWEIYNSSAPWNPTSPENNNCLALGGFGARRPYSYIGKKFWYGNVITEKETAYQLGRADINY